MKPFAKNHWWTWLKPFSFLIIGLSVVALVCLVVLGFPNLLPLKEDQARGWDILVKAIAGGATLITAMLALPKYFAERESANRAALAEARKPHFTAQQTIYSELLDATAKLSNPNSFSRVEVEAASAAFWMLYWGKLPLVVDDIVGEAVNRFEDELCSPTRDEIRLRNLSMALAWACADSLGFRRQGVDRSASIARSHPSYGPAAR